jgi:cytochrome c peroxidase
LLLSLALLPACGRERTERASAALRKVPARAEASTVLASVARTAAPAANSAPTLSAKAVAGKLLFFDPSLSASGKMSCATCHDPAHAYGPPNDLAVQPGGAHGDRQGTRAVPSLRYKEFTPPYNDLFENPDGMSAPGPGGGFTWDGRASTLADQAKLPLLSPLEMANASAEEVGRKIRGAPYAKQLDEAFGSDKATSPTVIFDQAVAALEAFQLEDPSFHPYDSKFDLYAGNKIGGTLTPAEMRGYKKFVDTRTGNCGSCHFSGAGINGSSGIFTDFSYSAIGVPRNREIDANRAATYFDLGLCGPMRTDHPTPAGSDNRFCGLFKTPTLRNAATRHVFFHNGVIHSLEQAIRFYATRDTRPELWYPTVSGTARPAGTNFPKFGLVQTPFAGGHIAKFDDLPPAFVRNIDPQLPLDGRAKGSKDALTEQDIQDLLCFIETLTDGYVAPASPPTSGRCVD